MDIKPKSKRGGPRAGAGRPKGAKNKVTQTMRESWMEAFDQIGGTQRLARWADENETEFFKLCARLIPHQIQGSIDHEHNHLHRAASEVDGRIEGMLARRQDTNRPETLPH